MHLLRIPNVQWLQSGEVDMSTVGHTRTVQMDLVAVVWVRIFGVKSISVYTTISTCPNYINRFVETYPILP
jgi:hypothetical protein